jgi:hypothetical protein
MATERLDFDGREVLLTWQPEIRVSGSEQVTQVSGLCVTADQVTPGSIAAFMAAKASATTAPARFIPSSSCSDVIDTTPPPVVHLAGNQVTVRIRLGDSL